MADDIQNSDDTASVFDNLAEKTDSAPTDVAIDAEQVAAPSDPLSDELDSVGTNETTTEQKITPNDVTDRLSREIHSVSGHIRDLEMLALAKVFHKIHISYYRSWTSDIREAFNLVTRMNRRKNEIEAKRSGKLPQDYRTG